MTHAVHALVSGIVQGVGYRNFTERNARALGLAGWVRNLYDGRVEVLVEGERAAVDALVEQLRRGPRSAEVTELALVQVEPSGEAAFRVRRDAEAPEVHARVQS